MLREDELLYFLRHERISRLNLSFISKAHLWGEDLTCSQTNILQLISWLGSEHSPLRFQPKVTWGLVDLGSTRTYQVLLMWQCPGFLSIKTKTVLGLGEAGQVVKMIHGRGWEHRTPAPILGTDSASDPVFLGVCSYIPLESNCPRLCGQVYFTASLRSTSHTSVQPQVLRWEC